MNLQGHRFSGNSAHNNENEDEIIEAAEILIDLDARMDEIHRNAIDEKSRAQYVRSSAKFLAWLIAKERPKSVDQRIITEQFMSEYDSRGPEKRIQAYLFDAPSSGRCPIKIDKFDIETFMQWLLTIKKRDGTNSGQSTYNTHRSAMVHFCGRPSKI